MRVSGLRYVLFAGGAALGSQVHAQGGPAVAPQASTPRIEITQANTPVGQATDAAPSNTQDDKPSSIAEIVVTARKRLEVARDVPMSITALGGAALAEAKISQVVDIGQRVPNFTVSRGANLPFSLIRGFGTGNNLSFEQAVGKFIDNVSYGRDQDVRLPLFDIERVEVLKGPQVLLYGNSTTAGALNITTKKPGADFAADGSLAYDFIYREGVGQAGMTLPVSPEAGFRVAGMFQNQSRGVTDNSLTGEHEPDLQNYAGRATFRAIPTDDLTITLKAEYHRLRERGIGGELSSQPVFSPLRFADAILDSRNMIDNDVAPFFQEAFNILANQTYQGDAEFDAGAGTINSTTAYRDLKFGQSTPAPAPIPVLNAYLAYRYKQFSQELRYTSIVGPFDVTAGGYFQHDTFLVATAIDFNLTPTLPPGFIVPPFALDGVLDQTQDSYSVFADSIYRITDRFSVELGGRYSWVQKSADQSLNPGDVVPGKTFDTQLEAISVNPALTPLFFFGLGVPPHAYTGLKLRDEFFQPQAVLQYRVTNDDQVYLKFVTGEKAGGFDYSYAGAPPGPTPAGVQFASERARSLEVGFKGLTLNSTIEFSLAAFRTTFTDLQAASFQVASFVVTNVGKARTQGAEFELTYEPFNRLTIGAGGAYLDAKYLDYPGQPCTVAQDIANGGTAGCVQDLSNTPTQFSSKWAGTFRMDYEKTISERYALGGGFVVFARSRYNASTNNEPLQEQQGYAQIDAHLDFKSVDERWTVALLGRNLTDERVLTFGSKAPGLADALTGYLSRGREVGVRVGFSF